MKLKKTMMIQDIWKRGKEPKIEILRYGLKDEGTALEVEASIIDAISLENLPVQFYEREQKMKIDIILFLHLKFFIKFFLSKFQFFAPEVPVI